MQYNVCQVRPGGPDRPSITDKVALVTRGRFKDYSESGIPLPDVSLKQASSQFSKSIAWHRVSTEIALKQHKPTPLITKLAPSFCHRLSEYGAVLFSAFCRLMPSPLRAQMYRGLWFLGARLYGPSCSFNVQRLPFGVYLKMKRLEEHQSLASDSDTSYLLTTRLPGHPVGFYLDSMSEEGVDAFNNELQRYLTELRAIRKPVGISHAICNTIGEPLYDYRMIAGQDYDKDRGDFIEPFATEDDFNNKLQTPALPGVFHRSGHKIVLTHADINMRNILYHNGRISGIIDWENAG
ncbi:hypothetical protein FAUST_4700 [Fusarium austroamericanum]|uniref:Aminoglycoside phosphotransferase domain-containing protein n=1 Tax=Fusarium austroamericanum TaxID=282268 RepID=A0AAN6C2K6_FUSAU|nr:hypothetical protein FAUST_4700 [Fusarium austroamericanum]